jgi:hypothetical protein
MYLVRSRGFFHIPPPLICAPEFVRCSITVQIPVVRIRRIRKFWGHLDPLLRGTDPDPSINKQNILTNLYFYCFVTSLKNDVNVSSKSSKQKNLKKYIFFVGFLKVTDGAVSVSQLGTDMRIRMRTKMHRSETLTDTQRTGHFSHKDVCREGFIFLPCNN